MLERIRESKIWRGIGDISVLQWLISLGAGTAGSVRAYLGSLPIHWVLLIGTGIFALAMFGLNQFHVWKAKRATPPIAIELHPSCGPSDEMFLALINNGKREKFHAQCTTLARRHDPNRLFQKTYDLPWEGHSYRHATIVRGESRNLLVATADENLQNQTEEVCLTERTAGGDKKTAEWSRWNRNESGPEYDIEVSVFGEGDATPYRERFTLKCGGKVAALEMYRTTTAPNR